MNNVGKRKEKNSNASVGRKVVVTGGCDVVVSYWMGEQRCTLYGCSRLGRRGRLNRAD